MFHEEHMNILVIRNLSFPQAITMLAVMWKVWYLFMVACFPEMCGVTGQAEVGAWQLWADCDPDESEVMR